MANTTVTKASELLLANVTAGVDAGRQKISGAPGFSEAMNNAKDEVAKVKPEKNNNTAGNKDRDNDAVKANRTVVDKPGSKEIKTEEPVRKDPIANEDDMAELTEEAAEAVVSIVNTICETLNVDEDDLKTAMENLGITEMDLLDPISIKDLCMELTGTTDSISLLTDGTLYDNVREIVQSAEDAGTKISADFGMTKEEITNIFEDETFEDAVKTAVADLTIKSEAEDLPKEAPLTENVKINDQPPIQDTEVEDDAVAVNANAENKEVTEMTGREAKVITVEVDRDEKVDRNAEAVGTTDIRQETEEDSVRETVPAAKDVAPREEESVPKGSDPAQKQISAENTTETFKPVEKKEDSNLGDGKESSENPSRFIETETIGINTAGQTTMVSSEVNNLGEVVETVRTYSNADAESIMEQVTESIRVSYTADTTSMEMQLHPASLGTVNMHIASSNGVITAQILVQNEAVKAVLESQLAALQQTFEEQGQKVEAVEVAVANYDLNRGGSSDTGSDTRDRDTARTQRTGTRRRINLNDLDEEDIEELSEDEQLTADMMARSGNSVDYTA